MVVIRLSRGGAKKRPFYNIIATDRQNRRDGRFIERVGYYNPIASKNETSVAIEMARIEHWVSHGAQVSPAVQRLIKLQASSAPAAA
jgi:small subunit ribosomal protein S16